VTPNSSNGNPQKSLSEGKASFFRESRRVATWPYYLFAIAAGAMLPIQFGINAQLAVWVGSPLRATLVSFVVGAGVLLVATLLFARGWPGTAAVGAAPWWVWLGGFLGAFYVLGSVVTAPKLGAAALFAFILAGQAIASLAVDHFGWVGFDENPVTPGRLLGLALVAAGVAAVRFL
jgi:transporter family-2 protein